MPNSSNAGPNPDGDVYPVCTIGPRPALHDGWDDPAWCRIPALCIAHFRPESSAHRPRTQVKLAVDRHELYGLFRVDDRFVRCVHTAFQAPVYKDSCVEFFVQPRPDRGYFNFEFNCGGAVLASYISDPRRTADGFAAWQPFGPEEGRRIVVQASLPPVVETEIEKAHTWYLSFRIPLDLLARYAGPLSTTAGTIWRGNFYKCGDDTSHPHWASWCPVDVLNFHRPKCFGRLQFKGDGWSRGSM